eukprot:CAMPEP_0113943268 /NCGR_PEP_ID=MMETSP1339-20121228/22490_1 /TAXON_ID=94617 /ORGANISM="Fibrocapsa japonica" /LENGTH=279 /DNA_ID=CAMNT_0000948097 /DNA_START=159 /DNA_END=998 /DNA_ORIENTATION=+ /assembly_acc=CAM_ASM_000762
MGANGPQELHPALPQTQHESVAGSSDNKLKNTGYVSDRGQAFIRLKRFCGRRCIQQKARHEKDEIQAHVCQMLEQPSNVRYAVRCVENNQLCSGRLCDENSQDYFVRRRHVSVVQERIGYSGGTATGLNSHLNPSAGGHHHISEVRPLSEHISTVDLEGENGVIQTNPNLIQPNETHLSMTSIRSRQIEGTCIDTDHLNRFGEVPQFIPCPNEQSRSRASSDSGVFQERRFRRPRSMARWFDDEESAYWQTLSRRMSDSTNLGVFQRSVEDIDRKTVKV